MKMICAVYRSRRNADTYLYVRHEDGVANLPEALLRELGGVERAMTLVLTPARRLARVDVQDVLKSIDECGYYLQMPPLSGFNALAPGGDPC
jgi:uncharacterized protein